MAYRGKVAIEFPEMESQRRLRESVEGGPGSGPQGGRHPEQKSSSSHTKLWTKAAPENSNVWSHIRKQFGTVNDKNENQVVKSVSSRFGLSRNDAEYLVGHAPRSIRS